MSWTRGREYYKIQPGWRPAQPPELPYHEHANRSLPFFEIPLHRGGGACLHVDIAALRAIHMGRRGERRVVRQHELDPGRRPRKRDLGPVRQRRGRQYVDRSFQLPGDGEKHRIQFRLLRRLHDRDTGRTAPLERSRIRARRDHLGCGGHAGSDVCRGLDPEWRRQPERDLQYREQQLRLAQHHGVHRAVGREILL